jgi:hypothetical protein
MKKILLISTILLFSFSNKKESLNNFDYELSEIVNEFRQVIMNKSKCEDQKREASFLVEDIKKALKDEYRYSTIEISNLKTLQKEAEALEQYIAVVGNCGGNTLSSDNFYLINEKVGGGVLNALNKKLCVNIISVKIGAYVTYLAENSSTNNYSIKYKWNGKLANGTNKGNGQAGMLKNSLRNIYDNRNEPKQKSISVYEIECKEF